MEGTSFKTHTSGSRVPHFWYSQQRMPLALVPRPCQRQHFRQMDVLHILKQNPCAGTGLWCFRSSSELWAALHRRFTFRLQTFFSEWRQQKRWRSFKSSSDIPVLWYSSVGILKSQGSQAFFDFQGKAYQKWMSSRLPTHTPTAGLAKIFLWWKNFHMFQKFCWPTFSRITSILNIFTDWNTSSLLPPPVFLTKVFFETE